MVAVLVWMMQVASSHYKNLKLTSFAVSSRPFVDIRNRVHGPRRRRVEAWLHRPTYLGRAATETLPIRTGKLLELA